jgi:hypothetical protein
MYELNQFLKSGKNRRFLDSVLAVQSDARAEHMGGAGLD